MAWQSQPLFISSTFADMQAERDHLRTRVFPELEERLKTRRRHLEWVDLRLGVATASYQEAQVRELHVLKVCLAEVRRCRPFLIVLLGDRYGWVPPEERMIAAAREEGFGGDIAGRSVTDLEIRFGVLDDPEQQPRSFFYFRDPLPYGDMPPDLAALYTDAYDTDPGAGDRSKRLDALKIEIATKLPDRARRYAVGWDREGQRITGLEAWGRTVLEDIWAELEAETALTEAEEQHSWSQIERNALADYIEDRARDFIGRDPVLARLEGLAISELQKGEAWGLSLTGGPGTGKSAIFGELSRRLQASDIFVLAHAAGASPRAPSVENMLRRWIEELGVALGIDPGLGDDADPDTIEAAFQSLLTRVAAQWRVVVLIDALDQFEATTRARFVTWLPRAWPDNARLIATAIPGDASNALGERPGVETLALPPLDSDEARSIAVAICDRYHRTLEPDVLDALLAKQGENGPAWGNVLWLVLAVEELNLVDADDFARAKQSYSGAPAEQLRALILDIVADLPTSIAGLYGTVFDRAEELFGANLARAFLGSIAVSRTGWRESDFRVLLPRLSGEPWDELRFASLRRLFRGQVRQRGALAQWDFNHAQMRAAVKQRLVGQGVSETRFHAEAAHSLLSLTADDPLRQSETMVHLLGSEDWPHAACFYGSPSLTQEELDGAASVLAGTVLSAEDGDDQNGSSQILRLLDATVEPQIMANTAHRIIFDLDERLADRATLGVRESISSGCQETFKRLTQADPGNAGWQRDLSVSHNNIGDVLFDQGKLAQALAAYQASHDIDKRLGQADPGNAGRQRDISLSQSRIGNVLFDQGNLAQALAAYQASHDILKRLTQADPGNAGWQRDLSVCQEKIGYVLVDQGNLSDALDSHQASLVIRARLAQADPGNARWQRDLASAHSNIGDVLQAQGDLTNALAAYQAVLAIAERLVQADPGNAGWQRDLSLSQINIGDLLRAQGNLAQAFAAFEASLTIRESLTQADPGNAIWQRELSVCHNRIGDVLIAQGNLAQALAAFQASHNIFERLAQAGPGNAGRQRDLSASQVRVGDVLVQQGNFTDARAAYQASHDIVKRLAQADPGNAGWQADLAARYGKLGEIHVALGDKSEAMRFFKSGRAIVAPVAEQSGHQVWRGYLERFDQYIAALER